VWCLGRCALFQSCKSWRVIDSTTDLLQDVDHTGTLVFITFREIARAVFSAFAELSAHASVGMLAFLTLDKHTCKIPGGTSGGQTLWMFVSVSRFLSGMRRLARRRRVWFRNFDHHEVLRWITVGSECCSAYLFTCACGSYKKPAYGACKRPLVQPMTQRDKACWSTPPAACGRCRLPFYLNADLDTGCDSGDSCAFAPVAGSLKMSPPLLRIPLRCTVFPPSRGACPARALA